MDKENLRMQMLSGIITEGEYKAKLEENKESLNEHYVAGGIVGVGAINQIPSREKSDYEMAFDYFLKNEKNTLKEENLNEMYDDHQFIALNDKKEVVIKDKVINKANAVKAHIELSKVLNQLPELKNIEIDKIYDTFFKSLEAASKGNESSTLKRVGDATDRLLKTDEKAAGEEG